MKKVVLVVALTLGPAFASNRQMVSTIGTSAKGQFVAVEEYGFNQEERTFYSQIRILNVWTSKYVDRPIKVELQANSQKDLLAARRKAKELSASTLMKYKIGINL